MGCRQLLLDVRCAWQTCLGKRGKQLNYLVKFFSEGGDAADSHLMNIGFPSVLSAHFLASFLFQLGVPEVIMGPNSCTW